MEISKSCIFKIVRGKLLWKYNFRSCGIFYLIEKIQQNNMNLQNNLGEICGVFNFKITWSKI